MSKKMTIGNTTNQSSYRKTCREGIIDKIISKVVDNIEKEYTSMRSSISSEDEAYDSSGVKPYAKNISRTIKPYIQALNEVMKDPEIQAELNKLLDNSSKIGDIIYEVSKEPLQRTASDVAKNAPKIIGAIASGIIKVLMDAAGAIPFVGAAINLGKALNDGSKAVSAASEAGSQMIESSSDAFIEIKSKVLEKLRDLEFNKKIGGEIYERTNKSIDEFLKPSISPVENTSNINSNNSNIIGGRNKSRRRINRRKPKTKRVRFAL